MSDFENEASVQCPYCGETITVVIDATAGSAQSFTVDCEVCCRPIAITAVVTADGECRIEAEREAG